MKKFGQFIKETPTINTDPSTTGNTGFSGNATNPVAGFDKTLWSYIVTNAYQDPMDLSYRWSNIFPVKKLSLEDINDMVDASNEFINYMNKSTLTKKTFKEFVGESKEAKKCPTGKYYCFTDKKCKKIPTGYRMGYGGRLAPDNRSDSGDDNDSNGGNGGNGNGGNGNGGNGGNGGGNGGGGNGGGGE